MSSDNAEQTDGTMQPHPENHFLRTTCLRFAVFARSVAIPALLVGLLWTTLYLLVESDLQRTLHALMLLFVTASIGIYIVGFSVVPGFVGALLVGIMVANIPPRFSTDIGSEYKSAISSIALVIILSRAGICLDVATVKSGAVILTWLSLVPNIVEILAGTLLARAFFSLPWGWSALVGLIIPAVSPAVVVPGCLALQNQGYGVKKGLTTIAVAATALGDVFCIAGFSVCMSFVFDDGSTIAWTIGKVCIEIFTGVAAGVITGYGLTSLFPPTLPLSPVTRCALLLGFGSTAVLGGKRLKRNAAGSLFVLVVGVICGRRWDKEAIAVNAHLVSLWNYVVLPLLFGTIGASVDFKQLDWRNVGYACAVISLAVIIRATFTVFATPTRAFTLREKGFLACAWIPKATVQAALAFMPLNEVDKADQKLQDYGLVVLAVGVVAIILTAPVGAVLIKIVGERWLTRDIEPEQISPSKRESTQSAEARDLEI